MPNRVPLPFLNRIRKQTAQVGVIGLGYVGLPLAVEFAKRGFPTVGIDVDRRRVRALHLGRSYIPDVPQAEVAHLMKQGRLRATTEYRFLKTLDAVMICVPTPLRKSREPDISYIVSATEALVQYLHRYQVITLESTTYPGTTEEVILPMLEATGLKVGRDFFLGFSPERIDPANPDYTTRTIPKVVSGVTPACRQVIQLLYGQVIEKVIPVSSTRVAEMVKLLENTFRSVNIGLVNELALMCHRFGVDVWEVIEAAKTKPFGFMAFYPGPGLGGHCLEGSESVVIRHRGMVSTPTLKELTERLQTDKGVRTVRHRGATFVRPKGLEILSFDLKRQISCFQPIQWMGVRPYRGPMVQLKTADGRRLTVTDRHPMIVQNGSIDFKWARDLKESDPIPVIKSMPEGTATASVDLIHHLRSHPCPYLKSLRVVPEDFSWRDYRRWLRPILKRYRRDFWEYYRRNFIPLAAFWEAEDLPDFSRIAHDRLRLDSGKGSSWSTFPAVIDLTESVCRLVGYYLSEGCITEDGSIRVRFSFHRNEVAYRSDVKKILRSLGVRYSECQSKQWQSSCIKVSSAPFGILLRDILSCGTDSYSMGVPPQLLGLSHRHREALLSGLLRGGAGVDVSFGRRSYRKNGRIYNHRFHTASLNYHSVSPQLFRQVVLLLQAAGITSTFKKRNNYLTVFGESQLRRCADWLAGEKRQRLLNYFRDKIKNIPPKTFSDRGAVSTVKVSDLECLNGTRSVYSVEVANTHTFVTSYGMVVHNCIPIDPLYLSWKAKLHGFEPRFIELSSQVNASMPEYVVGRIAQALNKRGKPLKGARILILGVAYKKDVGDTRESPALEILQHLRSSGSHVQYHDPFVPTLDANGTPLRSVPLKAHTLAKADCVVLVTDHRSMDYAGILRHAPLILDTRNAFRRYRSAIGKVVRL